MRPEIDRRPGRLTIAAVAVLVVAACALVLFATGPRGAGLTIDSTTYLLAADRYAENVSEVGPVLNGVFPPGYPAAIAAVDVVVDDLDRSAVFVNVVSFAVLLALIGLGVWQSGAGRGDRFEDERADDEVDDPGDVGSPPLRRVSATVGTVALVAFSTAMLRWTSAAMSETMSLALVFGAMAVATRGIRRGGQADFVVAGLLSGAAALVRLVALGSVFGVALAVLVAAGLPFRRRLVAAATVVVTGVVTSVVGVPLLASTSDSRRTIAWHPIDVDELLEGLDTIAGYTLPSSVGVGASRLLAGVAIVAAIVFVVAVARAVFTRESAIPTATIMATSVAVAHVGTVIGSMLFVDDLTPLDPRILLPVVPLLAMAIGSAVAAAHPLVSPRLVLVVGLLVACGQVGRTVDWVGDMRRDGMGYAHSLFDGSETLAVVRSLPDDAEVITNDVSLLYLRGDRRAAQLPFDTDNYSGRANEDFDAEVEALGDRLDEGAVIVYVDYFDFTTLPEVEDLVRAIGPLDVTELSDGTIIRRAEAS